MEGCFNTAPELNASLGFTKTSGETSMILILINASNSVPMKAWPTCCIHAPIIHVAYKRLINCIISISL